MENFNGKMLREIANDPLTPKKTDKKRQSDLFEYLADGDDDLNCQELESYEVITEYR
jgi:hypothetical protein